MPSPHLHLLSHHHNCHLLGHSCYFDHICHLLSHNCHLLSQQLTYPQPQLPTLWPQFKCTLLIINVIFSSTTAISSAKQLPSSQPQLPTAQPQLKCTISSNAISSFTSAISSPQLPSLGHQMLSRPQLTSPQPHCHLLSQHLSFPQPQLPTAQPQLKCTVLSPHHKCHLLIHTCYLK